MRSNKLLYVVSLLVILGLLLSACGTTATKDAGSDLVAAAKAEGNLTVIALPHDWCNYGEAIKAFSERQIWYQSQ